LIAITAANSVLRYHRFWIFVSFAAPVGSFNPFYAIALSSAPLPCLAILHMILKTTFGLSGGEMEKHHDINRKYNKGFHVMAPQKT
jgi:hypothetical protein